ELKQRLGPGGAQARSESSSVAAQVATRVLPVQPQTDSALPDRTGDQLTATSSAEYVLGRIKHHKYPLLVGFVFIIAAVGLLAYRSFVAGRSPQIESIAVLPFINESGNSEVEYLSDGMTDMLITSLSQLPKLSVKA